MVWKEMQRGNGRPRRGRGGSYIKHSSEFVRCAAAECHETAPILDQHTPATINEEGTEIHMGGAYCLKVGIFEPDIEVVFKKTC